MKMECILESLKDKEYIVFKEYRAPLSFKTFKNYKIKSLVGKNFKDKLIEAIMENEEYVLCNTDGDIVIAKNEDIDFWIEDILSEKEEINLKFGYSITLQLANYIRNKGYTLTPTCYDLGGYKIINDKIRNERLQKEEDREKKAIRFLNCLNG